MRVSSSASVADTAEPMLTPEPVFSATARVVLVPSLNTGALFGFSLSFVVTAGVSSTSVTLGVSSTSVTLIVTLIVSVKLPSETVIMTEYEVFVS